MNQGELISKITEKKELSQLPEEDVKLVLKKFNKPQFSDVEKIKFTRKILMEIYSGFSSRKILSGKKRDSEWILKKHLSTRERFPHYAEIYNRILEGIKRERMTIFDIGSGVNGFSYMFFLKMGFKPKYIGIEAIGQFVEKTNKYFKENKYNGEVFHESILDFEKIKSRIKRTKTPRVVFMLKVIDSLESLKRDYSKELILGLRNFVERFVVSFPTKSMVSRKKIWAKRTWFLQFVEENFKILDDFELGDERFIVFKS